MNDSSKRCVVCSKSTDSSFNLCKNCWLAGKLLDYDPARIQRLYSYYGGKAKKLRTKGKKFGRKNRNSELSRLIAQQRRDANDRTIRFEHAITK